MCHGRATTAAASASSRSLLVRSAGVLAALTGFQLLPGAVAGQTIPTSAPAPCEAGGAPYDDFDFWIGEWDVLMPDGRQAGTNRIEETERGCLLVERWTSALGGTGTSMNYFDAEADRWKQLWVSSDGTVIEIAGGLLDGSMALEGSIVGATGTRQAFRGTWTPNADGSVRQHFEISGDGGRTWATWFDGRYVRR